MSVVKSEKDVCSALRVLVVDDNEPSAMTLTWAMQMQGYDVETCFNGEAGVSSAKTFHPDVVLLDLGMPVMGGLEACRHILADSGSDRPLMIAQTGWGSNDMRRQTQEAGFDLHLTKPVDLPSLWCLLEARAH